MKLKDMVRVEANNKKCVVLKIKDGHTMDLICLGCFDGDEELIRVSKSDGEETITLFTESGKHWSWGMYTNVVAKDREIRNNVRECLVELGIMKCKETSCHDTYYSWVK